MIPPPSDPFVKFRASQAKRVVDVVRREERRNNNGLPPNTVPALATQPPNPVFAVRVYIDGGSAGVTGASSCTWTYTAKSLKEDWAIFGETLTPEARRIPNQKYTSTPDGTIGLGCLDEDGVFTLIWANETTDCT